MLRLALVATATLALVVPAAEATTFCVAGPDVCPPGATAVTNPNLQSQVLAGGHRSDGQADVALLDNETFTSTGFFTVNGSDPIEVRGEGNAPGGTVLTSSGSGAGMVLYTGSFGTGTATLRDLMVLVPASFDADGTGITASGDLFERVRVRSANPGNALALGATGVTFRAGVVDSAGAGSFDLGFRASGNEGANLVEFSSVAADAAVSSVAATAPVTVRRSVLSSTGGVVVSATNGAGVAVENSLLITKGVAAFGALAGGAGESRIAADHVTVVPGGPGNHVVVGATVLAGSAGDASVTITNSILRGFTSAYKRSAPESGPDGEANVTIRYSDFTVGANGDNGHGAAILGPGNLDVDPRFVGPADLSLASDSPLIDAGDPAAGGPAVDMVGNPRVNDGDRNHTAIRDMGFREFQAPPPDPLPSPPPTTPPGGGAPPPLVPGIVPPPLTPPTFGADTLVTLGAIALDRRGRVALRIRNRNAFAVGGAVAVRSTGAIPRAAARLGRTTLTLGAGATRTVRVRLSRAGRRALRRRGRLAVRVVAAVRAPSGAVRTVRKAATLKRRR
ncbi:MAG TPA: hypothetical protein VGW10_01245 [Solirubrobacteraceae bacterium]|nr:hypothetical protein [Solirubrobacteraceae bacterium]